MAHHNPFRVVKSITVKSVLGDGCRISVTLIKETDFTNVHVDITMDGRSIADSSEIPSLRPWSRGELAQSIKLCGSKFKAGSRIKIEVTRVDDNGNALESDSQYFTLDTDATAKCTCT